MIPKPLKDEKPWVDVHVVEVLEHEQTVPQGEEAIHWC